VVLWEDADVQTFLDSVPLAKEEADCR